MDGLQWYALYTKSWHEKKVNAQLVRKGIDSYLPLRTVVRQWSDRKKLIEEPLFRCYVFIHANAHDRLRALETYGAVRIVSFNGQPAIIKEEEIENIRRILQAFPSAESCIPFRVGDLVEVVDGPLVGVRGYLEKVRGAHKLIVAVDSIRQAVRIEIDATDVRVIARADPRKTPAFAAPMWRYQRRH